MNISKLFLLLFAIFLNVAIIQFSRNGAGGGKECPFEPLRIPVKHVSLTEAPHPDFVWGGEARSGAGRAWRGFVYLCPPKTGSSETRDVLLGACRAANLSCLTQESCPGFALTECAIADPSEWAVEHAAYTAERLRRCCPPDLRRHAFDGLAAHLHLRGHAEFQFLRSQFPADAFRFTILRDPVHHFISYHAWMTARSVRGYANYLAALGEPESRRLEGVVELFCGFLDGVLELSEAQLILFKHLSNYQSRVLGWDGRTSSLGRTLEFVASLDFVGLTEELQTSWRLIAARLGWPGQFFWTRRAKGAVRDYDNMYDQDLLQKIRRIQFADAKLYRFAVQRFRGYLSDTAH